MPFKMNCGGPALPDIGCLADESFLRYNPGPTFTNTVPVKVPPGAVNMQVYKTERVGKGALTYFQICVPPARNYIVTTMHAESYFSASGKRKFSIEVNGETKESSVDIFDRFGKDVALDLTFNNIEVENDGYNSFVMIKFISEVQNPIVNAITIVQTPVTLADIRNINIGGPAIAGFGADDTELFVTARNALYVKLDNFLIIN